MKLFLIALLFIINTAVATTKVTVENTKNGRKFGATFKTEALADAWIAKQTEKRSWGKLDRWEQETDEAQSHTNTREVEYQSQKRDENDLPMYDENQEPIMETKTRTEYFFPQEFVVTKEDMTAEVEAEKKKIDDRKKDVKQFKAALNLIQQDDTLKPYLKKILKRLVMDMRD